MQSKAKKRGEALDSTKRSYIRYKKVEKAINKATDNGRCWWLAKYLKNTLKG